MFDARREKTESYYTTVHVGTCNTREMKRPTNRRKQRIQGSAVDFEKCLNSGKGFIGTYPLWRLETVVCSDSGNGSGAIVSEGRFQCRRRDNDCRSSTQLEKRTSCEKRL